MLGSISKFLILSIGISFSSATSPSAAEVELAQLFANYSTAPTVTEARCELGKGVCVALLEDLEAQRVSFHTSEHIVDLRNSDIRGEFDGCRFTSDRTPFDLDVKGDEPMKTMTPVGPFKIYKLSDTRTSSRTIYLISPTAYQWRDPFQSVPLYDYGAYLVSKEPGCGVRLLHLGAGDAQSEFAQPVFSWKGKNFFVSIAQLRGGGRMLSVSIYLLEGKLDRPRSQGLIFLNY